MARMLRSFGWAVHGLQTVWREERNFKIEVVLAALVLIAAVIAEFPEWKWIFLILIIGWVLMGEIVNTVIEDICNKVQPGDDPVIGRIKDMMAGYVLVSSVCAAIAGIILFLS